MARWHRIVALSSAAAASVALMPAAPVHACSSIGCTPSAFLPESGSVPSNTVMFLWRPSFGQASGAVPSVQLYKLEQGKRTKLDAQISDGLDGLKLVRPAQPVAVGTTLVLESNDPACNIAAQVPAQITVSAEAPKPTVLGTLRITEQLAATTLHIPTSTGLCSDDFDVASMKLSLTLDASAEPFATQLQHALLVDGKKRPQPVPTPARGGWPSSALTRKLEDVLYSYARGRRMPGPTTSPPVATACSGSRRCQMERSCVATRSRSSWIARRQLTAARRRMPARCRMQA